MSLIEFLQADLDQNPHLHLDGPLSPHAVRLKVSQDALDLTCRSLVDTVAERTATAQYQAVHIHCVILTTIHRELSYMQSSVLALPEWPLVDLRGSAVHSWTIPTRRVSFVAGSRVERATVKQVAISQVLADTLFTSKNIDNSCQLAGLFEAWTEDGSPILIVAIVFEVDDGLFAVNTMTFFSESFVLNMGQEKLYPRFAQQCVLTAFAIKRKTRMKEVERLLDGLDRAELPKGALLVR